MLAATGNIDIADTAIVASVILRRCCRRWRPDVANTQVAGTISFHTRDSVGLPYASECETSP